MFSQKESVFLAVVELLKEQGISFDNGQKVELNKEQRKTVIEMVAQAALAGEMSLSEDAAKKYNSLTEMRKYCNGLVSNWLGKDTRLNGGSKHTIKNPGSRAGQGDEVLKNLKALRSQLTNAEHVSAVDEQINKRAAQLAFTKKQTVKEVNPDLIPESLKYLLKK